MLSLCAPVTAEIRLATKQGGLTAEQWGGIIAKLAALVNEFKVSGLELLDTEARRQVLDALEQGGKYFHLLIAEAPADDLQLLGELRRLAHFGSLVVDYLPEEAELAPEEASRYSDLREFCERALAVGAEVNASVELGEWACRHLESIIEASYDLGASSVICNRVLLNGTDAVSEETLTAALTSLGKMRDMSYSVSLGNCVPNCFSHLGERGCLGGVVSAFVNEKGQLLPCRCSAEEGMSLLDCSVSEAWHSPALEAWRQKLPAPCAQCAKGDLCPGGCRAAGCAGHPGDPLIRAPYCAEVEELHEVVLEEDLCPRPLYITRNEEFG